MWVFVCGRTKEWINEKKKEEGKEENSSVQTIEINKW